MSKLKLVLIFSLYCFASSAQASSLATGRCNVVADIHTDNAAVNKLIQKYTSSSIQICRDEEEVSYYVYSLPSIASKNVCFIKYLDTGIIKGDSYQSFFSANLENKDNEDQQFFSLPKGGYCEKNHSSYVAVKDVSYEEFKIIFGFFETQAQERKFIPLSNEKKDFEFNAEDFSEFNHLFVRGDMAIMGIYSESNRHEFNVRAVYYKSTQETIAFWLSVKIKNDGNIVLQRFSKVP